MIVSTRKIVRLKSGKSIPIGWSFLEHEHEYSRSVYFYKEMKGEYAIIEKVTMSEMELFVGSSHEIVMDMVEERCQTELMEKVESNVVHC